MLAASTLDSRGLLHPARPLAARPSREQPAPGSEIAHDFLGRLERIWQGARLQPSRRARAVVLGGERDPYEDEADAALTRAVLTELRQREGHVLELTTGSTRVLRDLPLLALLDQQHTVTVTYVLVPEAPLRWSAASLAPETLDLKARLHTVARLAGEGLTTHLLLRPRGSARFFGAAALAPLLAAADEAGVVDVRADARARGPWIPAFERLRLEAGFPRARPGRG